MAQLSVFELYFEGSAAKTAATSTKSGEYDHVVGLAKSLLAKEPMNITLWRAYAHLEGLFGHVKEAKRVYEKALSVAASMPVEGIHTIIHVSLKFIVL